MSAHTPGPWRWYPCKDGSFKLAGDYAQIASGKTQVAKVQILSVTEADLQLMVSAPALLVALQEALFLIEQECADGAHTTEAINAHAAIAKATGGAA